MKPKHSCSYCSEEIPNGRYGIYDGREMRKRYCCSQCKNRASTLRMAVRNPQKYLPKKLDELDKDYMHEFADELED